MIIKKHFGHWFCVLLIVILATSSIFFAWVACTIELNPLDRTYKAYNHMKIYEDGSYTGEDRNGVAVNGCLKDGLCQD